MSITVDHWRDRETVTVPLAARILGVTRGFMYEAVHRGEFGAFKVGDKWLVPVCRLRAVLDLPADMTDLVS